MHLFSRVHANLSEHLLGCKGEEKNETAKQSKVDEVIQKARDQGRGYDEKEVGGELEKGRMQIIEHSQSLSLSVSPPFPFFPLPLPHRPANAWGEGDFQS